MSKIIHRILIFILLFFFGVFVYLSTFGIKTDKLNNKISNKIKNINEKLELKLENVTIILNPFKFRFNIKTSEAIIKNGDKILEIENISSNISIKSLIDNQFLLTELYISTKSLEIKKLISFIRLVNDNPQLFIAEKLIKEGNISANFVLEFDEKGNIKNTFKINGSVNNGNLKLTKKIKVSKINFNFELENDNIFFKNINLSFNDNDVLFTEVTVQNKINKFLISGKNIIKKMSLDEKEIKDLLIFLPLKIEANKIEFAGENIFSFYVNNKFKTSDFKVDSKLNVTNLDLNYDLQLKNIFPKIRKNIELIDHKLEIRYDRKILNIKGNGNFLLQNEIDKIDYQISKFNREIKFNTLIKITDNPLILDLINFKKNKKSDLKININGKKNLSDNNIVINDISLIEKNNKLQAKEILLTKDYKIKSIDKLDINFLDNDNINNEIFIKKKDQNYLLSGENFNATKVIDEILKTNTEVDNSNLFKDNFRIDIKINNTFLDKMNKIVNLNGYLIFKNNEINEAILESTFSEDKKLKFTIKSTLNEKVTTLFTDDAKPFVNRYDFIKGFEEGNLDFYSIKKDKISKSTLIIDNFKVQEVPVLAKLLTLASLQGIADLLTGEGIRFTDFEMKFSKENELMKINELYAIGPAISIMMDGYIDKNQLISLRGTLVPATTINRTIASIPLIGKILVGKKSGEGVFGVSFKVKGSPKNLKTTVNPIKTLTPRFITRTLEKIKKN